MLFGEDLFFDFVQVGDGDELGCGVGDVAQVHGILLEVEVVEFGQFGLLDVDAGHLFLLCLSTCVNEYAYMYRR